MKPLHHVKMFRSIYACTTYKHIEDRIVKSNAEILGAAAAEIESGEINMTTDVTAFPQ